MQLLEVKNNIDSIWELDKEITIVSGNILKNARNQSIIFEDNISFYYSYKFLYNIKRDKIIVFDGFFEVKKEIFIENPVNISFYENLDNYLVRHGAEESKYSLFLQNKLVKEEENIIGVFLNAKYRLHFQGRFKPIRIFRCSDLIDSQTYWEYDCGEGFKADRFYVWNDTLVFVKGNESGAILVLIELKSGKIIWETKVAHGEFNLDVERGMLVSFWANKYVGKKYQVIDLTNKTIDTGDVFYPELLENVNVYWQQQSLHNNRLFFTDNLHSYGEDLRPIKFGCFDIETKRIDFIQEVPEAAGGQFAQIIYHDNRLYLRTSANELFIFESPA
jgi:virulence-associated protein VapD